MRLVQLSALCASVVLLSGCVPWIVSASMDARAKDQAAYSQYVTDMERLNTEREKAQLAPRPIMKFPEWKGQVSPNVRTNLLPPTAPTSRGPR